MCRSFFLYKRHPTNIGIFDLQITILIMFFLLIGFWFLIKDQIKDLIYIFVFFYLFLLLELYFLIGQICFCFCDTCFDESNQQKTIIDQSLNI